jgi:hypothetical protein
MDVVQLLLLLRRGGGAFHPAAIQQAMSAASEHLAGLDVPARVREVLLQFIKSFTGEANKGHPLGHCPLPSEQHLGAVQAMASQNTLPSDLSSSLQAMVQDVLAPTVPFLDLFESEPTFEENMAALDGRQVVVWGSGTYSADLWVQYPANPNCTTRWPNRPLNYPNRDTNSTLVRLDVKKWMGACSCSSFCFRTPPDVVAQRDRLWGA